MTFPRHISKFIGLFFSLGFAANLAAEPLKVAVVDMKILLTQFHKTKAAEAENKVKQEDIKQDDTDRLGAIKALEDEMRRLGGSLQDPSLADSKKQEIAKQMAEREQTYIALGRERQEFLNRKRRALTEQTVAQMNEIREAVGKQVEAHAATLDVDYVFDSSGLTTSQVPFILYVRNKIDITQDVLNILNKDAPTDGAE